MTWRWSQGGWHGGRQKKSWCMHENEVDVCAKTKTKCIGPNLFDAKCTRLACLLSFASIFTARPSLADVKHCFQNPTKCILLKYRDCSAVTKRTILIILIILDWLEHRTDTVLCCIRIVVQKRHAPFARVPSTAGLTNALMHLEEGRAELTRDKFYRWQGNIVLD